MSASRGGRSAPAPAVGAAVAFAGGIAAGAESDEGGFAALGLAAACLALLVVRFARAEGGMPSRAAGALLFAALGFAEGRARIAGPARIARLAFRELPASPDEARRIRGVVDEFWSGSPPRAHGRLRAFGIWDSRAGAWRPFPAEVFIFVSGDRPLAGYADRGDRVEAVGKLREAGLPASDRDIRLPWPAYRLSVKSSLRLENSSPTLLSALAAPNRWLFSRLPAPGSLGARFDRDVRGPLAALLLGRTTELDRGMVARYRRGGMYHLLVISGLHVALAAGLVLVALRAMSVRGPAREALLLGAVLLFVVVGGGNPPVVRAGIVFAIYFGARLLERPISAAHSIGLSALLLFAADPKQLYGIGTILTFAAVSGIAAFAGPLRDALPKRPAFLFAGLAAAVAAQIGTAPFLLWRFNVVSAGAWLTAPLSVPLGSALIALGGFLLVAFAAGIPAGIPAALFGAGSRLLEWMAERASGVAVLRPTPPLALVLGVVALLAAAVLSGGRRRALLFAGAGAVYVFLAVRPGAEGLDRGFSLEALDVGQGDALLIRWRGRAVLVDGGGTFDLDARDFGRTHLLPELLDRGVTRLDAVLLTHPHPDHALGLFAILDEIPVKVLWRSAGEDEARLYEALETLAAERSVPVRILRAGETIRWNDGARLAVLRSGGRRTKRDATNNQSVVARFERDGRSALLTGDAGAAAESEMIRGGRSLSSDVLKVGHHGSRGSTTPSFLAAVSPRAALLSCGRENRFGHPAAATLATLATARVPVFRTDLSSDFAIDLLPRSTRLRRRELP